MNTKQDYLDGYKFYYNANKALLDSCDLFDQLDGEIALRIQKNKEGMESQRHILKTYFKTFDEEIFDYCEAN